ncbi:MAG: type III pantothenate kinase [Phycisphaerales bacterium]|nr:type III pantothenate kinase [Phycisphaerales bacterium]
MSKLALIAIAVGNTRTHVALFENDSLEQTTHIENDDRARIVELVTASWKASADADRRAIAVSTVNEADSKALCSVLEDQIGEEIYMVGDDLPVPIGVALDPEATPGIDRLLNAAAAWDALKQACVVIDAGTAVTIDFVDGEGVFHGGVIAPGAQMQLDAMHHGTDGLPDLDFSVPEGEPYGRNTASAMQRGVYHGIRGLAWRMIEEYATAYEAFPLVVATGGDAPELFKDDELVNRLVPELELRGIAVAVRHALAESIDADE